MRRDEAYLLDIIITARRALKYMQGVSRDDFEKKRNASRCDSTSTRGHWGGGRAGFGLETI